MNGESHITHHKHQIRKESLRRARERIPKDGEVRDGAAFDLDASEDEFFGELVLC